MAEDPLRPEGAETPDSAPIPLGPSSPAAAANRGHPQPNPAWGLGSGASEPVPQPIAWIGDPSQPPQRGQWGRPDQLRLPLDDRGLSLADGLFETVLLEQGQARLLDAHLERWHRSAALLGMEPPPTKEPLEPLIGEAWQRAQAGGGAGSAALRLNWSRGSAPGRGIDLPAEGEPPLQHRFWLQLTPLQPSFRPVTVWISQQERRQATSLVSQCKTFAYGQAVQARREARRAGAEEALLLSTSGELCCGATANLLVRHGGTWLTPPMGSGCLPGVMRGRALELGLAREASLDPALLLQPGHQPFAPPVSEALLINSLGCRPIRAVQGQPLGPVGEAHGDPGRASALAESLWRSLLGAA